MRKRVRQPGRRPEAFEVRDGFIKLSARETEFLALYVQGNSLKEVAALMGLSLHTLATYRERILLKTLVNQHRCDSLRRAAWLRR